MSTFNIEMDGPPPDPKGLLNAPNPKSLNYRFSQKWKSRLLAVDLEWNAEKDLVTSYLTIPTSCCMGKFSGSQRLTNVAWQCITCDEQFILKSGPALFFMGVTKGNSFALSGREDLLSYLEKHFEFEEDPLESALKLGVFTNTVLTGTAASLNALDEMDFPHDFFIGEHLFPAQPEPLSLHSYLAQRMNEALIHSELQ